MSGFEAPWVVSRSVICLVYVTVYLFPFRFQVLSVDTEEDQVGRYGFFVFRGGSSAREQVGVDCGDGFGLLAGAAPDP